MKRFSAFSAPPPAVRALAFVFLIILAIGYYSPCARAGEIAARSAVVIDGATEKILYAKNPNWKQPPASTTKLVTVMTALDRLNPDAMIIISKTAAYTPSVAPHIRPGERFLVRDVVYLALMRSVNGAAVALAEAAAGSEDAFTRMMNDKVIRLGADNTHFINASGLPGDNQYITAFDLAKVMKESLKYPLIQEAIGARTKEIYSVAGRRLFLKSTNQLLWADDDCIGGKTGYTRAARHCFVSAAKKGDSTIIAAVLGDSIRDNLWGDSKILLEKGHDVIAQKTEPMIYFSSSPERPVVLASYDTGRKKHKLAKAGGVKKNRGVVSAVKGKKKRGGHVKIAAKGKKTPGKTLS